MKLPGRCSARKPAQQSPPTGTIFANRSKTQLPANGTRENLINLAARQRDLRKLPSTLPARWHILRENANAPSHPQAQHGRKQAHSSTQLLDVRETARLPRPPRGSLKKKTRESRGPAKTSSRRRSRSQPSRELRHQAATTRRQQSRREKRSTRATRQCTRGCTGDMPREGGWDAAAAEQSRRQGRERERET